ncbi:DUF3576 domain containing protein [Sulfitobacter noctilucicola]|uniref:Putative small lipoprotein YifL n=1 Tax=Sulfitobacter noctilucicola TaxID=1342301 RepID=A0A7W6M4Q2_9RHOB|nr:DUF3576 domain-containing protein [Sulfitobacter noctilucicola]KIN63127.1 DUF3576 domain containing protein [Sulfitobacter noctilucicola]MBB4172346.1 putative small lipoprotein YifL [Sulfitobacter noctilucicola]
MALKTMSKIVLALVTVGGLAACGGPNVVPDAYTNPNNPNNIETDPNNTIWSIFRNNTADTTIAVNKYLWTASLEVLSFLPVQSVDPFTGVIVTGYGTPPGGGRAYRATVLVDDPALDARSLNVALQTRGGRAVSKATARAVEDAILSRARELRIADNRF